MNLRLLALSPHYMLSEVLFQTKMTVLRNSAIHVSTKTVPYFHTTFHYFPVDIDGQVTILVAVAGRKDPGNEAQLLRRMITGEAFRAEKRNEHARTFLPRSPGRV